MSGPGDLDARPSARSGGFARRLDLGAFVNRLGSPTVAALLLTLIVGVIIGGLTAASVQRQEPVYESTQPLLIDQPTALALAPNGDLVSKLSLLRTKYVSLLQSSAVLDAAAAKLQRSAGDIGASIGATAPPQSLVILIRVRSTDGSTTPKVAEAVGESLGEYLAAEQEAGGVPAENRITLTALRGASAANQVEPDLRKAVSTGATGGLLAAALTYLILATIPLWARAEPRRSA